MSCGSKALNMTTMCKVYQLISQASPHYDTTGSTQDKREGTTRGLGAKKKELFMFISNGQNNRTNLEKQTKAVLELRESFSLSDEPLK